MKFIRLFSVAALLMLLAAGAAFAAMKYQCYTYKNGKPDKMTHVTANSNDQAVELAYEKFKKMGLSFDYVQCK